MVGRQKFIYQGTILGPLNQSLVVNGSLVSEKDVNMNSPKGSLFNQVLLWQPILMAGSDAGHNFERGSLMDHFIKVWLQFKQVLTEFHIEDNA